MNTSGYDADTTLEAFAIQKLLAPHQPDEENGKMTLFGQRKLVCDDKFSKLKRKKVLAYAFGVNTSVSLAYYMLVLLTMLWLCKQTQIMRVYDVHLLAEATVINQCTQLLTPSVNPTYVMTYINTSFPQHWKYLCAEAWVLMRGHPENINNVRKYHEALGKWEAAITLMLERAALHEQKAQV
nr:mediator of RNA polymerase II transcription subunit 23 [Tanacetum cinerariifolium]